MTTFHPIYLKSISNNCKLNHWLFPFCLNPEKCHLSGHFDHKSMPCSRLWFSESQSFSQYGLKVFSGLSDWFMSFPLSYICVFCLVSLFQLNSIEWQLSPGTTRREINLCMKSVIWGSDDMVPWKHHIRSCQLYNPISIYNICDHCVFFLIF